MEKNLKQELELLRDELGTPAFDERLDRMEGVYTSEEDKKLIGEYVSLMLEDIGQEWMKLIKGLRPCRWLKAFQT